MNIQGFFSAVRTATTNAASNVYGFSKDLLGKSYNKVSEKVSEIARRVIPTAVSNTVQAHPKLSGFAFGITATVGIGLAIYQIFFKNKGQNHP
ncbi:MAG: hypothetical protein LBC45_03090 [Chlamydiales bacterium]|jgi:hypothetical protein|nr:hypothetical protein [Chlamydiales bacterium]